MSPKDILQKVLRKGWLTSEFWLSVLGVVGVAVPLVIAKTDGVVDGVVTDLSAKGIAGTIAAGAIIGAYNVGRAYVKGKTAAALLAPIDTTKTIGHTLPPQ